MSCNGCRKQKVKSDDVKKGLIISFSNNDYPKRFNQDHDDPMVITATIHNYVIKRILIDQSSLVNILYSAITTNMNISKVDLKPHNKNLIRFFGKQVLVEGIVKSRVIMGTWLLVINMEVGFLIVDALNIAIMLY